VRPRPTELTFILHGFSQLARSIRNRIRKLNPSRRSTSLRKDAHGSLPQLDKGANLNGSAPGVDRSHGRHVAIQRLFGFNLDYVRCGQILHENRIGGEPVADLGTDRLRSLSHERRKGVEQTGHSTLIAVFFSYTTIRSIVAPKICNCRATCATVKDANGGESAGRYQCQTPAAIASP